MVDLTHIDLATEEDKAFEIDHWARLFKATTWEELKVLTKNNEYIADASQALFECNADLNIREQCLARAAQIKKEQNYQKAIKVIAEKDAKIAEQAAALAEKDARIAFLEAEFAKLNKE